MFQSIFSKQIIENSSEIQKINSSNDELHSKIDQIKSKISFLDEDRNKHLENSKKIKSKIENSLELLSKSKESEITSIKDEISYKKDLNNFFETLSSIHINDSQPVMEIHLSVLGESINFKLQREDKEDNLNFEMISCTKMNEQLPPWLNKNFSVERQTCSHMISALYKGLLNNFS
jgi:chromosome segregation ATPase